MKKDILYIKAFVASLMIMILSGCDKAPINGAMDGMWRVTSIEVENGETIEPYKLFYSIEQHSIEVSDKGSGAGTFLGTFEKRDGLVIVHDFLDSNGKVSLPERLLPFGLNELETKFMIVKSTRKKMIWQSIYATIYFEKF